MNIRSLVLIVLGLAVACFQPVSAEPPGTTVKHVNYAKQEVTLGLYRRDQGTKVVTVYKMDMAATITLDGVTVPLKKIHRGQHVVGMIESDPGTIQTLTVQTKG